MSRDDVPGYMVDEIKKFLVDTEIKTVEELEEYWQSAGGQPFEELAIDFIRMYMEAKDE